MPTHLQLEWRSRFAGVGYLAPAQRYRVIRYDARGGGLSQRSGADFSFDARMLDVDAVLDKLELAQVTLYAIGPSGVFAINYAALRPERVSALILSECFPSFASITTAPQAQALIALQRIDYETFTETMGSIFF